MGLESSFYHYVPSPQGAEKLQESLLRLGAQPRPSRDKFSYYVLNGPDYWIDIQAGLFVRLPYPSASIRVALTNPAAVLCAMKCLFIALLSHGGGYISDRSKNVFDATSEAGARYTSIDDVSWQRIQAAFEARQQRFRQHYGDVCAAISGDEVFDSIRQHHV